MNLPAPRTNLIGRDRERAAVRELLFGDQVRLLTLSGVGGSGKTRLAQAIADDMRARFEDRVVWVGLASVTDTELLLPTIAGAIGVIETPDTTLLDSLTNRLATPTSLLVLDNCEHLIDACAAIVEHLLSTCPDLHILATSREPFQIAGERQWRIPPLEVPGPAEVSTADHVGRAAAVQLFVERAEAVRSDFRLNAANAPIVAEICVRLAGIPLALELAAARVRVLSVEQILSRLDETFRLLAGGSRAAPARQQTLQAALDWSYDLLTEAEQAIFRRLAVFAGGFDLEAAETVASPSEDLLDLLTRLVDKSLVTVAADGPTARYSLLEPLRQYARRRLVAQGEETQVRATHAAYFLELAERAAPELRGPAQVEWLARLATEQDNLRAALRWAEECDDSTLTVWLATALVPFWEVRGAMGEGRRWLEPILANAPPRELPAALRAASLLAAGRLAFWQADLEPAAAMLGESLELGRAAADGPLTAASLTWLGQVSDRQREFAKAEQQLTESLALYRTLGDGYGAALATHFLGDVTGNRGDYERALPYFEESLHRFQALGDLRFIALASLELGALLVLMAGDLERADRLVRDGLRGLLAVGDHAFLVSGLLTLAEAEAKLGRRPQAARLLGATAALRDALGVRLSPLQREQEARVVSTIRQRLSEAALATALIQGRAMTVEQAIAESLSVDETSAAPQKPTPSRGPVETLTPREQEIARLLAQGATDREIATKLVIAVGTASVHVHNILGKLGLQSRWQVAAWAVEQGLIQDPSA